MLIAVISASQPFQTSPILVLSFQGSTYLILSNATLKLRVKRDFSCASVFSVSLHVPQTILPASAQDVYYRDEIGNISTSHLQVLEDSVEVEVRPRFPLFGGWKTHYIIGYNLPSYEYLYTLGWLIFFFFLHFHVIDTF